jgi:hypothetical protein
VAFGRRSFGTLSRTRSCLVRGGRRACSSRKGRHGSSYGLLGLFRHGLVFVHNWFQLHVPTHFFVIVLLVRLRAFQYAGGIVAFGSLLGRLLRSLRLWINTIPFSLLAPIAGGASFVALCWSVHMLTSRSSWLLRTLTRRLRQV